MEEWPTRKELESVQEERDLAVIITADLKSSSHCIKSAATARRVKWSEGISDIWI